MNANLKNQESEKHLAVTDGTFANDVLTDAQRVLLDFWAGWCGSCRMIAPLVHELATQYAGRAKVLKLNVGGNPKTAARFGISRIPALFIFKNGQVVDHITGFTSKKTLPVRLDAHLN